MRACQVFAAEIPPAQHPAGQTLQQPHLRRVGRDDANVRDLASDAFLCLNDTGERASYPLHRFDAEQQYPD